MMKISNGNTRVARKISGADAFQEELDYYKPRVRNAFSTISHIHVRLSDSIRNASRMRLVITDRYYELIANKFMSYSLDSIWKRLRCQRISE